MQYNSFKDLRVLTLNIMLFSAIMISCKNKEAKHKDLPGAKEVKSTMVDVNKNLLQSEEEDISDYIKRHNYKMTKTKSGLYYMIYENGNGSVAAKGKKATLEYELKLINNYICYSSKKDGPKEFIIGEGKVEKGLDEGVQLLKEGDKVIFIIPSYLGFGLLGDNNEIPKRATLIYDITVKSIK